MQMFASCVRVYGFQTVSLRSTPPTAKAAGPSGKYKVRISGPPENQMISIASP